MKRETIEIVVDAALREGRIEMEKREEWIRNFESNPEMATGVLAFTTPDSARAYRNYADDERDRKIIAQELGILLDEVI